MPEAVIFDVDGTLIDTVDFHAEAWQRTFRQWGLEFPYARIRAQIGKGSDQFLPAFLAPHQVEQFGKEMDEWRGRLFMEEYAPKAKPFPKVHDLFQRIVDAGQKIALATSANELELRRYLDILNVQDLVAVTTSSGDAERSKPHPDIFEAARAKLGEVASIAVGDTPYDAEAATRANMPIVGLLCGGFPEEVLRQAGCRRVHIDPADLLLHYPESLS